MESQLVKIEKTVFEKQMEIASVFANSDLVPQHFKKLENAWIALNMADRMGIDPFMLMQNTYIVHGKPGIEGKLVIALVNGSGKFSELEFDISGDGDDLGCVAGCTRLKTGKKVAGPRVTVGMAKKQGWWDNKGSKWPSMTELMLRYRAATFFARVNCPEVLFGMETKDEIIDCVDGVDDDPIGMIGYESVQKTETEFTLPPKDSTKTAEKNDGFQDGFPVICGNEKCPKFDAAVLDHCSEERIHTGEKWISAKCSELIRLSSSKALSEINESASGPDLISEAKAKLKIDVADTDEKRWAVVNEIYWGE